MNNVDEMDCMANDENLAAAQDVVEKWIEKPVLNFEIQDWTVWFRVEMLSWDSFSTVFNDVRIFNVTVMNGKTVLSCKMDKQKVADLLAKSKFSQAV